MPEKGCAHPNKQFQNFGTRTCRTASARTALAVKESAARDGRETGKEQVPNPGKPPNKAIPNLPAIPG